VFFAGVSGSAVADAASMSRTFVPEMVNRGYDKYYAGAITAASSMIGPIIPPSIIMIIYGGLTSTSVAALFVAGIVPGLLLATTLLALNTFLAHRYNHPGGRDAEIPPLLPSLVRALPALCLPVVILGSLVFGLATPTEGSAIAVLVAIIAGLTYRGLTWAILFDAIESTARLTGTIFIILAAISILGYLAGQMGWSGGFARWVASIGLTGFGFVLFLMVIFLVAGMVMDTTVAITLLVPLLATQAVAQGVDPVHLGIIICLNLCIGLITPPLGKCLVVVSAITSLKYWQLARAAMPFILVQIALLFVLARFPEITLALPRALGFSVN